MSVLHTYVMIIQSLDELGQPSAWEGLMILFWILWSVPTAGVFWPKLLGLTMVYSWSWCFMAFFTPGLVLKMETNEVLKWGQVYISKTDHLVLYNQPFRDSSLGKDGSSSLNSWLFETLHLGSVPMWFTTYFLICHLLFTLFRTWFL